MPLYITPPPPNPLVRFLTVLVSAVVLAISFALGLVVLAVVAGLGLVAALALWIRVAWIRHRLRQRGSGSSEEAKPDRPSQYLEGEYTVVRRQSDQDRGDL